MVKVAKTRSDVTSRPPAPVITLENVSKTFVNAGQSLDAVSNITLAVRAGEMVALLGPSGSGKSTLLHMMGLLEPVSRGALRVMGQDCGQMCDRERTIMRRRTLGFVYQSHRLLPDFSALENIILPQLIAGVSTKAARLRGRELLAMVGLEARATHRPAQLSGGEQQRVAIARALANSPRVILADEPTGNLDSVTAEHIFNLLQTVVREQGVTAVIATHNNDMAARMDRFLRLRDGKLMPMETL